MYTDFQVESHIKKIWNICSETLNNPPTSIKRFKVYSGITTFAIRPPGQRLRQGRHITALPSEGRPEQQAVCPPLSRGAHSWRRGKAEAQRDPP